MIIDSPIISGSFAASGSLNQVGDITITGSLTVTGEINGTALTATSASYALTASHATNVPQTASFADSATSASYAATASYISGSGGGVGFPFSGSAVITGSLLITELSGSGVRYLTTDNDGLIVAQTASAAIKQTQAVTSTAGQTSFDITNGYTTGLVDVFINGTKLSATEFTDTSGTVITLATGSNDGDTVEFVKYFPASGVTNNALRQQTTFTATAGQTVFSASYTPGLLDIFYNGSRLSTSDYTANTGTYFTLATASAADDILDVFVYSYQVGGFNGIGGAGVQNQVAFFNTTSSISGSSALTVSGNNLTVAGNIVAQTLVVQTITSSVDFVTGSTRFGSIDANTHVFTGSVSMNPRGLFVSSSGLVGVGTINPRFYTLHVVNSGSNAQIGISNQGTADGDRQLRMGFGGNGANTWAELQGTRLNVADDVNIALQPGGGNVGIGTTTPGDILDVQKNQNATTNFYFRNTNTVDASSRAYLNIIAGNTALTLAVLNGGGTYIAGTAGGDMYFQQNIGGAVNMVIKSGGNVGIGTTNPSTPLQVSTNSTGTTTYFEQNGTGNGLQVTTSGTAGTSFIFKARSSGVDRFWIGDTGNVGIGVTDPKANLHVASTLRVGPWFASNDRDFIELQPDGSNTKIVSPNETFSILNPASGNIDIISATGGVRLTGGATSWSSISDIRQKDIIESITDAISKVSTLSTVIYKFKDDETEQRRVGLIAQEVNKILPEAVNSFEDEEKIWSIRYTEVIPLLTRAIQEQQTLITALQEKLERNNII
jgi:hypothetical protein